jgi:hypothetical protein
MNTLNVMSIVIVILSKQYIRQALWLCVTLVLITCGGGVEQLRLFVKYQLVCFILTYKEVNLAVLMKEVCWISNT